MDAPDEKDQFEDELTMADAVDWLSDKIFRKIEPDEIFTKSSENGDRT